MTLRLTDEQTEALRRRAAAEHRSMQQVALAAIEAYVHQPASQRQRRQAVPVAELLDAFGDLPPMDIETLRDDQDRHIDTAARFDAYERARGQEVTE
jgi:hypothetical protein